MDILQLLSVVVEYEEPLYAIKRVVVQKFPILCLWVLLLSDFGVSSTLTARMPVLYCCGYTESRLIKNKEARMFKILHYVAYTLLNSF